MSIETTLYSAVTTDAGVRALISSGSPLDHRFYPDRTPDKNTTVPYITYQLISTEAHNRLAGAPLTERKVFQLNCIATSRLDADTLADTLAAALNVSVGKQTSRGGDYFAATNHYRTRLDFALIG